jgi:uncharacterized protein (TIGR03790 family)
MNKLNVIIVLSFLVQCLYAMFPDELVVVFNNESTNSYSIAKKYCENRKIPDYNIIDISIKPSKNKFPVEISHDTFTKDIWNVVNAKIADKGLDNRVQAWIYSVDIPTTIRTNPQVSITGLTFVKNNLPTGQDIVKGGAYMSPYFGGPGHRGRLQKPKSFSVAMKNIDESKQPIMSMMLGYIGDMGNSVLEVEEYLERGIQGDSTYPTGNIYFVTNSDVRTTCRIWQVDKGIRVLDKIGVKSTVQAGVPDESDDNVLGIWVGKAFMKTDTGCRYLPGSMVDNLTSFGARFQTKSQTKLSYWLRAGATLACGTVTEPYAIWKKFPTSYFWYFYRAGCTAIESFYQSTYCPLQQLFVGDPLVSPWGGFTPVDILAERVGDKLSVGYVAKNNNNDTVFQHAVWFLDGKEIYRGEKGIIDLQKYSEQVHYLTIHISTYGFIDLGCYGMIKIVN